MRHFDLCVIGTGSGNTIVDQRFDDQRVAIVDSGTFGGTCVNVGCIPTKMYVYPADLAASAEHARRLGVDLRLHGADWPAIRDRIFARIDALSARGRRWREQGANITLYTDEARFVGERTLQVGAETISAERIVLAAGSRPVLPDIEGLVPARPHTSDTVMRLAEFPASLLILGGGYVAAEFAHIFAALGSEVTIVSRSGRLLKSRDAAVGDRFTELLARRVRVLLDRTTSRVQRRPDGRTELILMGPDSSHPHVERVAADQLLVATGRRPNGDRLDPERGGVDLDDDGFVVVDEFQRTTAEGVYALGDVCSRQMLKHVANHEARIVQHNLLHPDAPVASDHRYIPAAVFSDPQVATVGLSEEDAEKQGVPYVVAMRGYGSTAYGWAMEDRDHFCKVLADPATGRLLGAHLIGPQASVLIQPLVQAMSFGQPAREVARGQYWPHPAMTEVVENTLLALPLD